MHQSKWQRVFSALVVAALLAASIASVAVAAEPAVVMEQAKGKEVTGTVTGGQFAKIWMALIPENPGTVTVTAVWDRTQPNDSGVGFYILDATDLSAVLGGESVQDNHLAAGDQTFFLNGPANQQGAAFRATSTEYTIVVFNDSQTDASFVMTVDNGYVETESDQVQAVGALDSEAMEGSEAATSLAVATEETTGETAVTATAEAAATAAPTAEIAEATPTVAAAVSVAAGPVSAKEMRGELPEQYDQHFLGLEPSIRDGDVTLTLSFDPQDSTELARRMNFWVLSEEGFKAYLDGDPLSDVALAAGGPPELNTRTAAFKTAGFGPYTVIVYNNSRVPATYALRIDGGLLIDDSGSTLTAQEAVTTTVAVDTPAAAVDTGEAATTTTPEATGREGEPGGTYTVQSGDTLALIARDIYGDFRFYEDICAFNNIADCNVIEVDQVIKLPTEAEIGAGTVAPAATAAPVATTAVTPAAAVATAAVSAATEVTATGSVTATSAATTTTTTSTSGTAASGSVVDVAKGASGFTTLVAALEQTGLDADLASGGPYTIFAPTDAAFEALLSGNNLTAEQLLRARELADILKYHVLSSRLLAADITNNLEATTLEGKPVTFEVKDGKVYINGAEIITTDLQASNGVIHAIDAVILPPQ